MVELNEKRLETSSANVHVENNHEAPTIAVDDNDELLCRGFLQLKSIEYYCVDVSSFELDWPDRHVRTFVASLSLDLRIATCGLCSRRRQLPHVCFLAVSAGDLKVAIVTKAPEKLSDIYILVLHFRFVSQVQVFVEQAMGSK